MWVAPAPGAERGRRRRAGRRRGAGVRRLARPTRQRGSRPGSRRSRWRSRNTSGARRPTRPPTSRVERHLPRTCPGRRPTPASAWTCIATWRAATRCRCSSAAGRPDRAGRPGDRDGAGRGCRTQRLPQAVGDSRQVDRRHDETPAIDVDTWTDDDTFDTDGRARPNDWRPAAGRGRLRPRHRLHPGRRSSGD